MWLWLEAMTMAFSLDMVLGFLFITLFVLGVELLLGGWIGIILRSDILRRIFLTWFLGECILILSTALNTAPEIMSVSISFGIIQYCLKVFYILFH